MQPFLSSVFPFFPPHCYFLEVLVVSSPPPRLLQSLLSHLLPPVSLWCIWYTGHNVIFLKIRVMFTLCLATFIGPPPDYRTKSKFLWMVLKALPQLVPTYFSSLISWKSLIQTLCPSQTKLLSSSNMTCIFTPPLYTLVPLPQNFSPAHFLGYHSNGTSYSRDWFLFLDASYTYINLYC